MPKPRKHFSPEEKVAILRRHLVEKVPVSTVCEEAGIQPSLLYHGQKQFFENGAAAFQSSSRARHDHNQDRIGALEAKLRKKDEVLAELMEEHVTLKKVLGNSEGRLGPARHPRSGGRLRAALVGEDRDRRRAVYPLVRHRRQQVLPLAAALRPGQ